jgi:hypothetical protein
MGDATNMVIVLAGELLKMAEGLIRIGLHPSDIVAGYEKAQNFALKMLDGQYFRPFLSFQQSHILIEPRISRARYRKGYRYSFRA